MKLDIGAGATVLTGFESWDIKDGRKAYPIELPDNSIEEIHASHILEHFSHRSTLIVLKEWVRVLRPGGLIQIAVPDFNKIIEFYKSEAGRSMPIEGYIMGGHVDQNDFHHALFTEEKLKLLMEAAGLENITEWNSVKVDCSALPISLNLQGNKKSVNKESDTKIENKENIKVEENVKIEENSSKIPVSKNVAKNTICCKKSEITNETRIFGCWTTPRLGFLDTCDCMYQTLPKFGISSIRCTGAFWEQGITKAFKEAIKNGAEWILTLDYDSIWDQDDIIKMVKVINDHPGEIDALCPNEWNRQLDKPLWTPIRDESGNYKNVNLEDLYTDRFEIGTGHFGLTLIRVSAIKALPKPWFLNVPNKDGEWEEGKVDADIYFWNLLRKNGYRLWLAPQVSLGHLELDIRWPGKGMKLLHQHFLEYRSGGKPENVFDGKE